MKIGWYKEATVESITENPRGQASDLCLRDDLESVEWHLVREDFASIINDQELFWLAFCKAVFPNQNSKYRWTFSIAIDGKVIRISGKEHIIEEVKKAVEEIRNFFTENSANHKDFNLIVFDNSVGCFLKRESSLIDASGNSDLHGWVYRDYIKSALPMLATMCGTTLTIEEEKDRLVKWHHHFPPKVWKVEVHTIHWQAKHHMVYRIPPKEIPERVDVGQALYSLYQQEKMCDFTLVTKKNGIVKCHSSMLYLYGGTLQELLSSGMRELMEGKISFEDYSPKTVRAFLDYIYLGGPAFSRKFTTTQKADQVNLLKLFELANRWMVKPLIDTCTNLISLGATEKDIVNIQPLAAAHHNDHLSELCKHLLSPESKSEDKKRKREPD